MSLFIETDIICNRCGTTYKSFTGTDGFSIMYRQTYFSICPKCSEDIIDLMGVKREELLKKYASIHRAKREMKVGDKVRKVSGYAFAGTVFGIVEDPEEGTRVIVKQAEGYAPTGEKVSGGAKHIFSPQQLKFWDETGLTAE